TLDTAFGPYNGLANRRLRPLGHLSKRPTDDSRPRPPLQGGPVSVFRTRGTARVSPRPSIGRSGGTAPSCPPLSQVGPCGRSPAAGPTPATSPATARGDRTPCARW